MKEANVGLNSINLTLGIREILKQKDYLLNGISLHKLCTMSALGSPEEIEEEVFKGARKPDGPWVLTYDCANTLKGIYVWDSTSISIPLPNNQYGIIVGPPYQAETGKPDITLCLYQAAEYGVTKSVLCNLYTGYFYGKDTSSLQHIGVILGKLLIARTYDKNTYYHLEHFPELAITKTPPSSNESTGHVFIYQETAIDDVSSVSISHLNGLSFTIDLGKHYHTLEVHIGHKPKDPSANVLYQSNPFSGIITITFKNQSINPQVYEVNDTQVFVVGSVD